MNVLKRPGHGEQAGNGYLCKKCKGPCPQYISPEPKATGRKWNILKMLVFKTFAVETF